MMIFFGIVLTVSAIALVLFALYLLILVRPNTRTKPSDSLLCDYAHRGLHGGGIPENSLAAFARACEKGIGIELDVQLSRDGKVMVFHDYTLVRMTGCEKKLCELDAQELQTLKLASTEQTVPTFEEVLELVGGRVPLLIELKGENMDTSLCKKVAEILDSYGGEYCLESFNPLLIREIQKYLPHAFCGQLYTNVCRDKKKYSALNVLLTLMAFNVLAHPDFIAYNKQDRNSLPVRLTTRLYRAPRFVWTVKNEQEHTLAHSLGEHPIFEQEER